MSLFAHTPKILVTGAAGALATELIQNLCTENLIYGLDSRPMDKLRNFEPIVGDSWRKSTYETLKHYHFDAIIHLGIMRNPLKHRGKNTAAYCNLQSTSQILRLCHDKKIPQLIFLSSANLYGPSAQTAGFVDEDAPLHGANRSPEIRDLVSLDMMLQSFLWKAPEINTCILRPTHIVGRNLNNAPSRYLKLKNPPMLLGFDPLIQLIHPSDVIDAIKLCLKRKARGIFNLSCEQRAPLSRILEFLQKEPSFWPESFLRLGIKSVFALHLSQFPPGEVDHLKYSCLIETEKAAKDLGFSARHTLKSILKEAL